MGRAGAGVKPQVETFQAAWELDQFVALVERLHPSRILEIGCWHGGTLWHWLQLPDVTVVAVDDQMRESADWQDWALEAGSTLHTIQGDSHDPAVVEDADDLGPYSLVFIDADHTYEAVRADWENYRPMVAVGGAVAFHDILPRPSYGVSQLWAEIKAIEGARWVEIAQNRVEPGNEGRCGVGVVWL